MTFTMLQLLGAVFSAVGLLFVLWAWAFLDNRRSHDRIHDLLREHDERAAQNLAEVLKILSDISK